MASFDRDAFSTDAFSEDAFEFDAGPPPPPPVDDVVVRPSGGFPAYDRGPTKEQRRRSRILFGLEAEVVEAVAARQAEALDLDEHQRKEELLAELRLAQIEARVEHFEALARQRQALIDEEIALRLKAMLDDEAAAIILICGMLIDT